MQMQVQNVAAWIVFLKSYFSEIVRVFQRHLIQKNNFSYMMILRGKNSNLFPFK